MPETHQNPVNSIFLRRANCEIEKFAFSYNLILHLLARKYQQQQAQLRAL